MKPMGVAVAQTFESAEEPSSVDLPERNLWVEVLKEALLDLTKGDDARHRAERWFQSSDEHIGSFLWLCNTIGLNPTAIRRGLGA